MPMHSEGDPSRKVERNEDLSERILLDGDADRIGDRVYIKYTRTPTRGFQRMNFFPPRIKIIAPTQDNVVRKEGSYKKRKQPESVFDSVRVHGYNTNFSEAIFTVGPYEVSIQEVFIADTEKHEHAQDRNGLLVKVISDELVKQRVEKDTITENLERDLHFTLVKEAPPGS